VKKSFTTGLEGLFTSKVTNITRVPSSKKTKKKATAKAAKKEEAAIQEDNTSFKSSLDALFQESFDSQGLDSLIVNTSFSKKKTKRKPSDTKGFDALFTPTVDVPKDIINRIVTEYLEEYTEKK